MHAGKLVFAQVMECAQLTYRENLRDIDACLRAQPTTLVHLDLRGTVSRSALADAKESLGVELHDTVYALDATTIDLGLALFPWASFRATTAAVKLHTLLDLRGAIPACIPTSDGTLHGVYVLDLLISELGAFYVMDCGYLDFERLDRLHQAGSFFVTRAKSNFTCNRLYSRPVDRRTGLICDQDVELTVFYSPQRDPARLRRIRYRDAEGRSPAFLTNHLTLPALTVYELYRRRRQVERFFK
jgi:hypothetical protein